MEVEKFLQLEEEMKPYHTVMRQATEMILDKEVSKYPIFVLHQQEIEIGVLLADRSAIKGNWTIHASTLEEFVAKNIIQNTKIEEFKKVYKDPQVYFCCFVLSELGANFVFLKQEN